jgi:hypothetical protein
MYTPENTQNNLKAKQLTQQAINVTNNLHMCWQKKHIIGVLLQQGTVFKQMLEIGIQFFNIYKNSLCQLRSLLPVLVLVRAGHTKIIV